MTDIHVLAQNGVNKFTNVPSALPFGTNIHVKYSLEVFVPAKDHEYS